MRPRIGSQIKRTRDQLTPDRAWVSKNRASLMSIVEADMANAPASDVSHATRFQHVLDLFVPAQMATIARSALALLLTVSVATGGWIATVAASAESLPGERLHSVKLATEGVELAVSKVLGSEESEVATKLKHATKRAQEYQKSENSEQKQQAIQALKKNIESSKETLAEVEQKSSKKAVAVAKVVDEKTEEILEELSIAAVPLQAPPVDPVAISPEDEPYTGADALDPAEIDKLLEAEVAEVEDLIEKTGVEAIAVLIEEGSKGDADISAEEVQEAVNKKVSRLASDLTELSEELKETVEQTSSDDGVTDDLATESAPAVETTDVTGDTSSTTEDVLDAVEPVSDAPEDDTADAEELPPEADTALGEEDQLLAEEDAEPLDLAQVSSDVKKLLEGGDVAAAIQTLQTLTDQKMQAKVEVTEAREEVEKIREQQDVDTAEKEAEESAAEVTPESSSVNSEDEPATEDSEEDPKSSADEATTSTIDTTTDTIDQPVEDT